MKNIIAWLITSSADPHKISLAVKGILVGLAPVAMLLLGWTDGDITALTESIGNIVFWTLSIVSGIQVVLGLIRKVNLGRWSSFNG